MCEGKAENEGNGWVRETECEFEREGEADELA